MKNRILAFFILYCFYGYTTSAQTTAQGTIVNTSSQRASIYVKPSAALTNQLFLQIDITVSIPDQGVNNPVVTVDSNFVTNLTWSAPGTAPNPTIYNGRAYYTFFGDDNGSTTGTTWTTGNNKLITLGFSNTNGLSSLTLNDELPSGGSNSLMLFYVIVQGAANDITNYPAKFYGTNPTPVNNTNTPSLVGAQSISLLPIALRDFNVSKQGTGNALLTWTTSFEQNASHFVVERSVKQTDNWAPIAQVKAKGNSSIDTKYEYTDANIYDGREVNKTVFYRLKEVDLDGGEKVFPVRSLKFSALGDKDVTVFPNPARTGFYVQIPILFRVDQKIRLNLVNRLGQVVDTREISTAVANNYYYDISAPSITSGDYALDIIYDGQKLATKKILVNR